jgi:hypothetical protein
MSASGTPRRAPAQIGAPWSMKMGTIVSLSRYDGAAIHALQSVNLRRPAILRYALWAVARPAAPQPEKLPRIPRERNEPIPIRHVHLG